MAILTAPKIINQERFDLEDFLTLLSGLTTDEQYKISGFWAPTQFVLKGFAVSGLGGPSPATIGMSGATLLNPNNSGSFSWFKAQSGASNITVALNSGVRNYIELQLSNVDGTPLTRAFWDPAANGGAGAEFSQIVNTITSLQIQATALQGGFSGSVNTIPIAIVDTDGSNNIKLILDKRPMLFRLINPQAGTSGFAWSSQTEPSTAIVLTGVTGTFVAGEIITFSGGATATVVSFASSTIQAVSFSSDTFAVGNTVTGGTSGATGTVSTVSQAFTGGDKDITNMRDALSALQTEIKRLKGTAQWFNTGYGSVAGCMNQIDSILVQSTTATKSAWSWAGNVLKLTDANVSPSNTDILAVLRILGSGISCNLLRQDAQASTSSFSLPAGNVLFIQLPASGAATYSGIGTASTNFQITPLASYVISDQNYWLAFAEGTNCYVRGQGFLQSGESETISDPLPQQFLANIGFTDQITPATYSSNIRGSANESLVSRLGVLTDAAGDAQEDRSSILRSDGLITFNGTQVSWTNDIVFEVLNSKSGTSTTHTIQASGSPLSLNAEEVAYITINRSVSGNENVTLTRSSVTPIPAQTQANKDVIVIFKRHDVAGVKHLIIPFNKQLLQTNDSFKMGSDISQNLYTNLGLSDSNGSASYSSNIRGASGDPLVTRIGTNSDAIGDLQEDRSAYFRSDSPVVWTGTQLTFTSNIVLEILNTKSGTTTVHTISSASSPITVNNGESIYAAISRTAASETVTAVRSSITPIPAQTQANKDIFVLCKCVQSSGGTNYLYLPFMKSLITPGQSLRLGQGGGSGSGSGGINYIGNPDAEGGTTGWSTYNESQPAVITQANPGIITLGSVSGYSVGTAISFTTAGTLPTPLLQNTTYYVSSVPSGNSFQISATKGGASINITSAGSGIHTLRPVYPIAGTGGSITNLTFAASSSSPLRGLNSFTLTQSNSSSALANGVSYDFTIDPADQAKVLSVSFDYNASSNFTASSGQVGSDSDLEVFLYDKTNGVMLPLAPKVITGNGANNFTFKSVFQASSNSTSYRLIIGSVTTSAPATGYVFKWDNCYVGPQTILNASPVTDWTSYVMTIGATTTPPTKGTTTVDQAMWRRVGDSMEITYNYNQTAAGSNGSGIYLFPLPSGYSIDTSKTTLDTAARTVLGHGIVGNTANPTTTSTALPVEVTPYNSTNLSVAALSQISTSLGDFRFPQIGSAFDGLGNTNVVLSFTAKVPIAGWSSTVQMSQDADTRVVAAKYYLSANTTPGTGNQINFDTKVIDTHGAVTTGVGAWKFVAPVSGIYDVAVVSAITGSTSGNINLYKNGSSDSILFQLSSSAVTGTGFTQIQLNAGDYIDVRMGAGTSIIGNGAPYQTYISIGRKSGPSAIAATESVRARYTFSTSQTLSTTPTAVNFDTKTYDSHLAASGLGAGWKFTAPSAGTYSIKTNLHITGSGSGPYILVALYKNGAAYVQLVKQYQSLATDMIYSASDDILLQAGDYIQIFAAYTGGSGASVVTDTGSNSVAVSRIGN